MAVPDGCDQAKDILEGHIFEDPRVPMGGQPYQPFAVEQKADTTKSVAEQNPFADPGWGTGTPGHTTSNWQDVHLDTAHTGASTEAAGQNLAEKPPAWAYAAAEPTWEVPPQAPVINSTGVPTSHNAPAYYGTGAPEYTGQTIYNVNQAEQERCRCNLDWWLFGIGFFTGIAWLIGAFLPYCRTPRHPTRSHQMAHRANSVMSIVLVVVVIIAAIYASRSDRDFHNNNGCAYYYWGC
ncbi:hypothetical protein WJX84_012146 [Apatococcus fuscideae]|uniref:Uncharacterized protein n=1 Tax=Apatococcus fuscideae TaxID=2026836 RepID=A0AAW1TB57_9CHLO